MGSVIGTIVGGLIMGLILGPLARLLIPGKQDISLLGTILVGAGAAIIGGFIADLLGVGNTSGIDWIKLLIQLALAVFGIVGFATAS
ncbi:MAG: GlsB/YeaQ/YmgE family stress response membrane protein, partial [Actinomycetota bacterium]|nr:GlsB/YeaQ/YmgE family stress response membrane protein [Actinomycetota bacterium]